MNKLELMKTANEIRKGIVTALHSAKAGHPGGSLSATEIFTYLYFEEMNVDPKDPKIFYTCAERILPEGRSRDTSSYRILSAGTSGHETHSRC